MKKRIVPALLLLGLGLLIAGCDSLVLESGGAAADPLVAPRAVQVTALDKSLMVNWSRIAAAQQYDPTYQVYYGEENPSPEEAHFWGTAVHDDSNLVSITLKELTNGTTYYVWVKAVYGSLGASDYSPTTYGIPVPPPQAPVPQVAGGEGLLEVSWPADPHAYFYELHYIAGSHADTTPVAGAEKTMTAEAPVSIGTTETAGLIITGLPYTLHTVWVKASNTAGDSAYARCGGTPQQASSKPDAPAILDVTPGNKKLTVTWTAQARASGYKVYYNTVDTFSNTAPSVDAAPFFGRVKQEVILPANQTTYYVWVTAYNNTYGESAPSPSASGKPAAPTPINFNDVNFKLGTAQAEYIFSEVNPPGPFNASGELWDRLTRRKETALGNLFCDGSAWYIRTKYEKDIDFVFLNGGLLDQPLNRGTVTVGSIESILPPSSRDDFYTLITLRGPELKLLLDQAAKIRNPGHGAKNTGGWGMVSAEMRYTIQYLPRGGTTNLELYYTGEIKQGSATLNGKTLDAGDFAESKTYRICTANYLAGGGDGYTAFVLALKNYPGPANVRHIQVPIWKGVSEYIYDQGSVTPYLDGRVKQEGGGVMCEGYEEWLASQ